MSNLNNIKLGNRVRDIVTGYTGIATSQLEMLNGNTQFSILPETKNGEYPDPIALDYHTLEVIDKAFEERTTQPTLQSVVKLGDYVECLVTKSKGVATMRCTYMNGCVSFVVTDSFVNKLTGSHNVVEEWFDQVKLKVIGEGVDIPKNPANKEGNRPGGLPTRNIPRS